MSKKIYLVGHETDWISDMGYRVYDNLPQARRVAAEMVYYKRFGVNNNHTEEKRERKIQSILDKDFKYDYFACEEDTLANSGDIFVIALTVEESIMPQMTVDQCIEFFDECSNDDLDQLYYALKDLRHSYYGADDQRPSR